MKITLMGLHLFKLLPNGQRFVIHWHCRCSMITKLRELPILLNRKLVVFLSMLSLTSQLIILSMTLLLRNALVFKFYGMPWFSDFSLIILS